LSDHDSTRITDYLTVARQDSDGAVVVTVSGDIDMGSAPLLAAELASARRETHQPLIIDMAGVTFMGSAGLQVLADQIVEANSTIELRDVQPNARRVLEICQMLDLFELTTSPTPVEARGGGNSPDAMP
jgi:anti-sigma B factor antagonist